MCLDTKTNKTLTATAEMEVYKIIRKDNTSFFRHFQYKANTLYRLRKALQFEYATLWKTYEIDVGYHAYVDWSGVIRASGEGSGPYYKVVKFFIPKGAKYVLGARGDIVSTSIRSGSLRRLK